LQTEQTDDLISSFRSIQDTSI